MIGVLAQELGISVRLIEAAKRVGVSPAQARELAMWLASLSAEERETLVCAAAKLSAQRAPQQIEEGA